MLMRLGGKIVAGSVWCISFSNMDELNRMVVFFLFLNLGFSLSPKHFEPDLAEIRYSIVILTASAWPVGTRLVRWNNGFPHISRAAGTITGDTRDLGRRA